MKNKALSLILGMIIISSFGASASSRESLNNEKFTGWNYDSELKQDTYYKDGSMVKNSWINTKNKLFYFKADGSQVKGWQLINGNWYYFDTIAGAMLTGWVKDSGNYYYLNADGTMAHDTYIDGYKISSDGSWVK